jgi:hypothetical protein
VAIIVQGEKHRTTQVLVTDSWVEEFDYMWDLETSMFNIARSQNALQERLFSTQTNSALN